MGNSITQLDASSLMKSTDLNFEQIESVANLGAEKVKPPSVLEMTGNKFSEKLLLLRHHIIRAEFQ